MVSLDPDGDVGTSGLFVEAVASGASLDDDQDDVDWSFQEVRRARSCSGELASPEINYLAAMLAAEEAAEALDALEARHAWLEVYGLPVQWTDEFWSTCADPIMFPLILVELEEVRSLYGRATVGERHVDADRFLDRFRRCLERGEFRAAECFHPSWLSRGHMLVDAIDKVAPRTVADWSRHAADCQPLRSDSRSIVCPLLGRHQKCRLGSNCKFSHDEKEAHSRRAVILARRAASLRVRASTVRKEMAESVRNAGEPESIISTSTAGMALKGRVACRLDERCSGSAEEAKLSAVRRKPRAIQQLEFQSADKVLQPDQSAKIENISDLESQEEALQACIHDADFCVPVQLDLVGLRQHCPGLLGDILRYLPHRDIFPVVFSGIVFLQFFRILIPSAVRRSLLRAWQFRQSLIAQMPHIQEDINPDPQHS